MKDFKVYILQGDRYINIQIIPAYIPGEPQNYALIGSINGKDLDSVRARLVDNVMKALDSVDG